MPQIFEFDEFVKGLDQQKPDGKPNRFSNRRPGDNRSLVVHRGCDITPKPVEWLWQRRIACGKQTLLVGEPSKGKSQLICYLAATVTTGGAWPSEPGKEDEYAPLGSAIILSAEDDPSDTTVPRLMAAGADMSRVHIVSGVRRDGAGRKTFNISSDIDLIEQLAREIGDVRLVSIDPISAYFGGGTDTHNNAEVRSALEPVSDMAARLGIAVVCVSHFSKNAGAGAMNRIIGSQAFVANARAAFMIGADPDDQSDTRRMFLPIKNNLAPLGKGLTFHLGQLMVGDDILASRVWWDGRTVDCTADEILSANSGGHEEKSVRAEAEEFLSEILQHGPVLATEVKAKAAEVGISAATLRRAKATLKVRWERRAESGNGLGSDGKVYWLLPATPVQPS